ncbi:MAG: glycosyltransferase [Patescibacteria group bacterium]
MFKNSDIKISFIIPVYNSAKYLNECVDSILSQSYENFEIILVDDGSSDSSPSICDYYSARHNNIIVIHQENSGVASSRNVGIKQSSGDYLFFIDNDDWIDGSKIINLIGLIRETKADIIINKYCIVNENSKKSIGNNLLDNKLIGSLNSSSILKYFVDKRINIMAPWEYVVKRSVLIDNQIFFYPSNSGVDDSVFTPILFCYCNSFAINNDIIYFWRRRADSQGRKIVDDKYISKMISTITILESYIIKFDSKNKKDYLYFSVYKNFFALFGRYYDYSSKDRVLLKEYFLDNKGLIKKSVLRSGLVHRILNLFCGNFFGLIISFRLACFKGIISSIINYYIFNFRLLIKHR